MHLLNMQYGEKRFFNKISCQQRGVMATRVGLINAERKYDSVGRVQQLFFLAKKPKETERQRKRRTTKKQTRRWFLIYSVFYQYAVAIREKNARHWESNDLFVSKKVNAKESGSRAPASQIQNMHTHTQRHFPDDMTHQRRRPTKAQHNGRH